LLSALRVKESLERVVGLKKNPESGCTFTGTERSLSENNALIVRNGVCDRPSVLLWQMLQAQSAFYWRIYFVVQ